MSMETINFFVFVILIAYCQIGFGQILSLWVRNKLLLGKEILTLCATVFRENHH